MHITPVLRSFAPSTMRSDRWALKQEIFWNLPWVSVTSLVCCPLRCRAVACMVWNWIPSPAELLRSSIPMPKSRWLALKRQTAETSTIWLWAMSLSATTKCPISLMTSWDSPFTTISLPRLWIRFVPVVWSLL